VTSLREEPRGRLDGDLSTVLADCPTGDLLDDLARRWSLPAKPRAPPPASPPP